MKQRLIEFIDYVNGGKMSEFADRMGWSPQYLNRLTSNGSIGLRPIISLLEEFPELNARWLILGEGVMLSSGSEAVKAHLRKLLDLEKYMPVMSKDELAEFANGRDEFPSEAVAEWQRLLAEREQNNASRYEAALKRSTIKQ